MNLRVLHHSYMVAALGIGTLLSLWITPTWAETVVLIPSCGVAGTTKVCITGSGWPEPSPPCRYRFFLDGARPGELATDQQDGLFGPPKRSFTIPAGTAAGNHNVTVDLLQNSNDKLLGGPVTKPLKVVDQIKESFKPAPKFTGARIDVTFDPTDSCDVSPCSRIGFVQSIKEIGTRADGTERPLKPNEFKNYDPTNELTNNTCTEAKPPCTTASFVRVDRLAGRKGPYYGGNGAGTGHWGPVNPKTGLPGGSNETGKTVVPTTMDDTPVTSPANWPADIAAPPAPGQVDKRKVTRLFEVAAFCIAGDDIGEFFGKFSWKFEREFGKAAVSTLVAPPSNVQPSQDFKDALKKWLANHSDFKLPQPKSPPCQ